MPPDCDNNQILVLDATNNESSASAHELQTNATRLIKQERPPYTTHNTYCQPGPVATANEIITLNNTKFNKKSHYKNRHSLDSAVFIRVRELSDHQCFIQNTLKIGQTSPKPSNKDSPKSYKSTNASGFTYTSESSIPITNENISRTFFHNASDITEIIKSDAKNLTDCFQITNNKLNSSIFTKKQPTSVQLTVQRTDTHINRPTYNLKHREHNAKFRDKTISCRLYDCIPKTCTARNESCESSVSKTPTNIVKLDLDLRKSSISYSTQLSKKKFLFNVMDRSVDSIGSCSLDVDAESTDFSGTVLKHCCACDAFVHH